MYKPRGPYKRQFTVDKRQLKNILELWVHWCAFENHAISKITLSFFFRFIAVLSVNICSVWTVTSSFMTLYTAVPDVLPPHRGRAESFRSCNIIYLSPTIKTFDANFVMTASFYNKTAFLYQAVYDFLRRFLSFKFFADYKYKWPQSIQGWLNKLCHQGTWAKAFLSDACQPEVDFLHSWALILPKFSVEWSLQV